MSGGILGFWETPVSVLVVMRVQMCGNIIGTWNFHVFVYGFDGDYGSGVVADSYFVEFG